VLACCVVNWDRAPVLDDAALAVRSMQHQKIGRYTTTLVLPSCRLIDVAEIGDATRAPDGENASGTRRAR
jgi:hypothetical protein